MPSDQSFIDYLVDQLQSAGTISYRKMFGEYALYCDGKVVALVCDNQLFVKPTEAGRVFIGKDLTEGHAYPSAKPSFLVTDNFEDRDWLSKLISLTAAELPLPKPKKPKLS